MYNDQFEKDEDKLLPIQVVRGVERGAGGKA